MLLLAIGCADRAVDSPEDAFVKVKVACQEKDWARLYDTLPPDTQGYFTAQVNAYVQSVIARAKVTASTEEIDEGLAVQRLLGQEMKVTIQQWEGMIARQQFAVWFEAVGGSAAIKSTGFDPDLVAVSELKGVEIVGATARVKIDDGKGHRLELAFVLVDRIWRLDLGYE